MTAQDCTMPVERRTGSGGHRVPVGTRKVRQSDGHTVVKTVDGWRYAAHIIAEEKMGRPLRPGERVTYLDGDHTNLAPDNIGIPIPVTHPTARRPPARTKRAPRVEVALGEWEALACAHADADGVTVAAWIKRIVGDYLDRCS